VIKNRNGGVETTSSENRGKKSKGAGTRIKEDKDRLQSAKI